MKTYSIVYTMGLLVEAESEEDAILIAAEEDLNDFALFDVEVEEYK